MTTLKNILRLNAVTSGATGLGLAFMPRLFAGLFEVEQSGPFVGVGIFLIVFAAAVWTVSRPERVNLKSVNAVIFADVTWVIGSIALIILDPFSVSLIGNILIAGVALWVLLMAYTQFRAAKAVRIASANGFE